VPKNIENLSEKIRNKSFEIFMKRGYENTDMRYIAKELNIAVGTLYNYYPSKKVLFNECTKLFETGYKTFLTKSNVEQFPYPESIKEILVFIFRNANEAFGIWKGYIEMMTSREDWNSNKIGNIKIPNLELLASVMTRIITKHSDVEKMLIKPKVLSRLMLMTVIGLLIDGAQAGNEQTIRNFVDITLKNNITGG